jgi:DNA modification methylase
MIENQEQKYSFDNNKKNLKELGLLDENYKIKMNYNKTCNCPDNHISCINAKDWLKSQVAIQEFYYEKRDIRNKDIHPAVFPIGLPKFFINLLTHKGELVLDPFGGIGTTLIAAHDLNRNAIAFDLKEEYVNYANNRVNCLLPDPETKQIEINDNALNIPKYLYENSVKLIITSPPYANLLNHKRKNKSKRGDLRKDKYYNKIQQYSNDKEDLGTLQVDDFVERLGEIYRKLFPLLIEKGHSVIDITDLWDNNVKYGRRLPLHIKTINKMESMGYELRNIIIWDRRNLVNKAGIFGWPNNYITLGTTFEYLLDFWKPPKA